MVIVNGFWCMFCETEVTEVSFVETPGVAMGVKTVTVPVFETDENGVVDCFAVLVAYSFVRPEVTEVIFLGRISKNINTEAMA